MTEIKFDKRNYRKHNDKNKKLIRKSLKECGAGRSIFIDSEGEIWKDIKDFEGKYQISSNGKVRSLERYVFCKSKNNPNRIKQSILKQRKDKNGYWVVNLKKNGKSYIKKIHRLIAQNFIKNPNNLEQVNHINGNKEDNSIKNLEWCSAKENSRHRTKKLLVKPKLSKEDITFIVKNVVIYNDGRKHKNSISDLAKRFNVCRNTISDIVHNKKLYLGVLLCK